MVDVQSALAIVPAGLREPLITEYQNIVQSFLEQRWRPAELSGGLFSEIVYTILDGRAKGRYANKPSKPKDLVTACRQLESNTHVPRSFQILIPRMLPALYEIRNNRNVGHTGGDVDPNHMDSVAVLSMCNWIMGELVRVYHNLTITEAQQVVDALAEVRLPVIWSSGNVKRVLRPSLKLQQQIMLLAASTVPCGTAEQLRTWIECDDVKYFMKTLRRLHKERLLEFDETSKTVQVLPPGANFVRNLIRDKKLSGLS